MMRFSIFLVLLPFAGLQALETAIPIQGNAFLTEPNHGRGGISKGAINLRDSKEVYSLFFHVNASAKVKVLADLESKTTSQLSTSYGKQNKAVTVVKGKLTQHPILTINVPQKGYVRIDLKLAEQASPPTTISDIRLVTETAGVKFDFVRNNDGNMFYWGRRGPSVHLRYSVPKKTKLRYAYSEVTVPQGQDTLGSFYMANGFGQGYFGFQVNSPTERRILFSVWSPYKTDNPKDIPEDQRIVKLASGEGVHVGEFGNEGSGGQSYLRYPWKAGQTYRFLTEVVPDGKGKTNYTAWFSPLDEDWKLIASFSRPKTNTTLTGFHSFLENFQPTTGHIGRSASYSNVWVVDVDGGWHECNQATFSVDATGGGRHRLDFNGGSSGESFFLKNCGFFDETGKPGTKFTREKTPKPEIRLDQLPR